MGNKAFEHVAEFIYPETIVTNHFPLEITYV